MCFEFSLCSHLQHLSLALSRSLIFLLLFLSFSLTHTNTDHSLAFLLISPFSAHESVPFMCIWGLWLSLTTGWQRVAASISVGGFQRSLQHRAAIDGASFMDSEPPRGSSVWQKAVRGLGSLLLWPFTSWNYNTVMFCILWTRGICSSLDVSHRSFGAVLGWCMKRKLTQSLWWNSVVAPHSGFCQTKHPPRPPPQTLKRGGSLKSKVWGNTGVEASVLHARPHTACATVYYITVYVVYKI